MLVRKAEKRDIKAIMEMCRYSFNVPHEEAEEWKNKEYKDLDERLVCENDEGIVTSSLQIIPFKMYLDSSVVNMGGIAAVASFPEYRYGGAISTLMKASIKVMKDNGVLVSALGPFSHSFYRKYGYEMTFQHKLYKLKTEDLKKFAKRGNKYIPLNMSHLPQMKKLFDAYAMQYNGMVVRTDDMWQSKFNDRNVVKYGILDNDGKLKGYILFKFENKHIFTDEIVYNDPQTRNDMLGFLYMHNAQREKIEWYAPKDDVTFMLMDDMYRDIMLKPFMMSRIIDIKPYMEVLAFPERLDFSFVLKAEDKHAVWNEVPYLVTIKDGKAELTQTDQTADLEITIQDLIRMTYGLLSFSDVASLGTAKINIDDTENLIAAFPRKATNMIEYF